MEEGEQGAVSVVLLRRIKAQLAPRAFKKATGKPADFALVRQICDRLDQCLALLHGPDHDGSRTSAHAGGKGAGGGKKA